jgi:hypothetical protein
MQGMKDMLTSAGLIIIPRPAQDDVGRARLIQVGRARHMQASKIYEGFNICRQASDNSRPARRSNHKPDRLGCLGTLTEIPSNTARDFVFSAFYTQLWDGMIDLESCPITIP